VATLLGHTRHTGTNGESGVGQCVTFFSNFFNPKMGKKYKALEAKRGNKSRASKQTQQSAPLASVFSTMEMAKKHR